MIRLALEAGRTVPVSALARVLWPEGGSTEPGHAIQSLVSRLRRTLPTGVVRTDPTGYRLDLPADAVDVARFERLADAGRQALRRREPAVAVDRLRGIVSRRSWRPGTIPVLWARNWRN
jgi:DNA-binding SARP family transcriptional activator